MSSVAKKTHFNSDSQRDRTADSQRRGARGTRFAIMATESLTSLHFQSTSSVLVSKLLECACIRPCKNAVKKRYHFAHFAVMLVKLQQCPGIGETRLQCPKFVARVSSFTNRFMNLGPTPSPIGQGNLFFLEQFLVFGT